MYGYRPEVGLPSYDLNIGWDEGEIPLSTLRDALLRTEFGRELRSELTDEVLSRVRAECKKELDYCKATRDLYVDCYGRWWRGFQRDKEGAQRFESAKQAREALDLANASVSGAPSYIADIVVVSGEGAWYVVAKPEDHPDLYRAYFDSVEGSRLLLQELRSAVLVALRR